LAEVSLSSEFRIEVVEALLKGVYVKRGSCEEAANTLVPFSQLFTMGTTHLHGRAQ
jgi:hypothetical protein